MARIDRRDVFDLYEEIYVEEKPGLNGKVPVAAKKSAEEMLADNTAKNKTVGLFAPERATGETETSDGNAGKSDGTWPYWSVREILDTWDEENLEHIAEHKQIEMPEGGASAAVLDEIARVMTDERTIASYFYILSDEEDEVLRKYIISEGEELPDDMNLLALLLRSEYIGFTDEEGLMFPRELVQVYQKVSKQAGYHDLRHKRHWLASCVKMANKLYGTTPGDILQELIDKEPTYAVKRQDLWSEISALPSDVCRYEIKDDTLLSKYINDESREQILSMQGDMPFYKPTREEIIAGPLAGYNHRLVQKLTKFLQRETYLESKFSVNRLVTDLLDLVIGGMSGNDATDVVLEHADIKFSPSKREKLDTMLLEISYNVPSIVLRGFKPVDMSKSRLMSLQDNALKIFAADLHGKNK